MQDIGALDTINLLYSSSYVLRREHDENIGPYFSHLGHGSPSKPATPTLHQHDFVYLLPDERPGPFLICRIEALKQKGERTIARLQPFASDSSHRIRPRGQAFTCVDLQKEVVNKCTVVLAERATPPVEVIKGLVTVFWATRGDVPMSCSICDQNSELQRKAAAQRPSLKSLDLCCGAGGLSQGLHLAAGQRPRIKSERWWQRP